MKFTLDEYAEIRRLIIKECALKDALIGALRIDKKCLDTTQEYLEENKPEDVEEIQRLAEKSMTLKERINTETYLLNCLKSIKTKLETEEI